MVAQAGNCAYAEVSGCAVSMLEQGVLRALLARCVLILCACFCRPRHYSCP